MPEHDTPPSSGPAPSAAALAVATTLLPRGEALAGVDGAVLAEMYAHLQRIAPRAVPLLDRACQALDLAALASSGRRLGALSAERRLALMQRWALDSGPVGGLFTVVAIALKLLYFDRPEIYELFDQPHDKAPARPEPPPAHVQERAAPGHERADEELEAEVVVVGSGAAGAIVAKELAQRGHAVLMVEAGRYFRRDSFDGHFLTAASTFYHWRPENIVLGNVAIAVPTGATVGGSTTINTATSFRPLHWVHDDWVAMGLPELSRERMAPYFEEVEAALQIEPTPRELWGRHVERMAELLDRRGLSHGPIRRNAPDCDGQNACDYGCPSGGKYSMDVTYVPWALRHGAQLLTETRLERVLLRGRRVRGVRLVSGGRRFQVAAPRVVLCCGTFATPRVLWDLGLGGEAVGRNLTIHPSVTVQARLPEPVSGFGRLVPSSHHIDQFGDQRLMLISANLPLDFGAVPLPLVGPELMREMERFDHHGNWGAMIAETSRGRLRRLPGGRVATTYRLNDADRDRLMWGLTLLCELYLEAGAEVLYPSVRGCPPLRSMADVERLRRATVSPRDLLMTAYHPLGTCRMGRDPRTSVVDPEHRVRGVRGLSIADGSVVPGPLGVNSQLTIMAFARRAADILHAQLDEE